VRVEDEDEDEDVRPERSSPYSTHTHHVALSLLLHFTFTHSFIVFVKRQHNHVYGTVRQHDATPCISRQTLITVQPFAVHPNRSFPRISFVLPPEAWRCRYAVLPV
jgi:hypothetical protein